jgi:cystathionine beta-lyase
MVHGGVRHIPFASVSETAARCAITFMAPSKTFNIAGVVSSYVIVQDPALADRFFRYLESNETDYPPIFSAEAMRAAYTEAGKAWRLEMLDYVQGNIDFVDGWLRANLPQIRAVRPQASFLVWLDCRRLGLPQPALVDLFVNKARLALNDGTVFGPEGTGFMRLNVGCPRSNIRAALASLKEAINNQ